VDEIAVDPANLRVHNDRSLDAVAASLRRFGQQKPIVVDANGVVIAGNGTLEAARRLGWTHIAAVSSHLVGTERVAYSIADNRTGELSRWDTKSLAATLDTMDPDALASTGFTAEDLAELTGRDTSIVEDEAPAPLPEAITAAGEMWTLGDHRIMCGDSTNKEHVAQLLQGEMAELVATDPPYLVDYTGERMGDNGKDWSALYREVDIKDVSGFYTSLFTRVLEVLAPHAAIYCWHAHRHIGMIQRIWAELGILDHQQIIWVKPSPVIGRCLWYFQHEPCVVGWRKGSKPHHDGVNGQSSVWVVALGGNQIHASDAADTWVQDWEGKGRPVDNEHPTQKPLELFARPMRKHTKEGALCFEPFSGSGSQIIAGEQLKRRVRAMELQPVFVDVAVRRWQALTGRAATLDGDGRTWDEIAAERRRRTPACPPSHSIPAPDQDAPNSPQADTAKSTRGQSASVRPGSRARRQPQAAATDQRGEGCAPRSSPEIPSAVAVEPKPRRASTTSSPRPKAARTTRATSKASAGHATGRRAPAKGARGKRPEA
jgi:DNA modification methylase